MGIRQAKSLSPEGESIEQVGPNGFATQRANPVSSGGAIASQFHINFSGCTQFLTVRINPPTPDLPVSCLDLPVKILVPPPDDRGENDIETVHLIGTPPVAVPEHPDEYLVV